MRKRNKKVREKSRQCYNHNPQPFPDTKRKRKQIKPNKCISEKTYEIPMFKGLKNTRTQKHQAKLK